MNNFNEQKEQIIKSGYKYISLYRGNEQLCAWNQTPRTRDARFDDIENRLNNDAPGVYHIKARNSTSEKNPVTFVVNTGSEKLGEIQPQIIYKDSASDKLLENTKILDLTVELKQLEMENRFLKKQIADLEAEILELENATATTLAEATPAPSLMESAKDFLGSLMEFGAPLLDQHFSLKKQQLEIEALKLQGRRAAPVAQPVSKDPNVQIRKIGEFVETFADQPEIYEALHEISAKSQTVDEFMNYLNQFNPAIYDQLSKQI